MKRTLCALAVISALATTAQADTLDFESLATGDLGTTVLVLSNATVTGFGSSLFNLSAFYGAGQGGSICSLTPGFNCQADLQIDFNNAVSGLSFQTFGYDGGDSVDISAYAGATLLGTVNVTSNTLVDFSAYSGITSLYMDDASTGAGYGYGAFNFAPVPESGTYALMLAGLAAVGARAYRRHPQA